MTEDLLSFLQSFVCQHNGEWTHSDWHKLLSDLEKEFKLRSSNLYNIIGLLLEREKHLYKAGQLEQALTEIQIEPSLAGIPDILLVEDDKNQRLMLKSLLTQEGFSVTTASDGAEAVELCKGINFDLVVMDINMPGMNGIEAMGKIVTKNEKIPIIFYTAYSSFKDNFMTWSADAYIIKSSNIEELTNTIRQILNRGRAFEVQSAIGFVCESTEQRNKIRTLYRENFELRDRISMLEKKIMLFGKKIESLEHKPAEAHAELEKEKIPKGPLNLIEFGNMIASLTHDLRSAIAATSMATQLLLQKAKRDSDLRPILRNVELNNRYCQLIIDNLSDLVLRSRTQRDQVDIYNLLDDVLSIYGSKVPENVTIIKSYTSEPLKTLADAGQIQRAFMNIIENAVQAMPKGGTLTITTTMHPPEPSGNIETISISFSDTGIGIPEENIGRIFDLSFTTKKTGYGLGLYIVEQIIGRHKGRINVTSEVNKGTIFTIQLPVEREDNVS